VSRTSISKTEEITNKNFNDLTESVIAYGVLHIMHHMICSLSEDANYDISALSKTEEAPSLWKIFYDQNKKTLSLFQVLKARLFYFFFYEISVVPKIINTYANHVLNVARNECIKDPQKRKVFIEGLLHKMTQSLTRINAQLAELPRDQPIAPFLPNQLAKELPDYLFNSDLFLENANDFLKNYPVSVKFGFGEKVLNRATRYLLQKIILPKIAKHLPSKPCLTNQIKEIIENEPNLHIVNPNLTHLISQLKRLNKTSSRLINTPELSNFNEQLVQLYKNSDKDPSFNRGVKDWLVEGSIPSITFKTIAYINADDNLEHILNESIQSVHDIIQGLDRPLPNNAQATYKQSLNFLKKEIGKLIVKDKASRLNSFWAKKNSVNLSTN